MLSQRHGIGLALTCPFLNKSQESVTRGLPSFSSETVSGLLLRLSAGHLVVIAQLDAVLQQPAGLAAQREAAACCSFLLECFPTGACTRLHNPDSTIQSKNLDIIGHSAGDFIGLALACPHTSSGSSWSRWWQTALASQPSEKDPKDEQSQLGLTLVV